MKIEIQHLIVAVLLSMNTTSCKESTTPDEDTATDTSTDTPSEMDADLDGADTDEPDTVADVITDPGYDIVWGVPPWNLCLDGDEPAGATIVTAFDQADQYFNPDDLRNIDAVVEFPETGSWQAVAMKIELECPADGDCDNWDRFANVMLVENPDTLDEEIIELERYITPYNVGMCIVTDVSRFAPRLRGTRTIRSFIDTWVGPTETVHGHGWRTTVKFIFHPGAPGENVPDELHQLVPYMDIEIGNPDNTIADQVTPATVDISTEMTRAELRLIVTGHGQGSTYNCAEFCNLNTEVTVNSTTFDHDPWRGNCHLNPIGPLQSGTWTNQRSGWCPGAYVEPFVFDVTDQITAGTTATIDLSWATSLGETYLNTCRPGAGDGTNTCTGCAFYDTPGNCDYDGGMHTMPNEKVSVQLLVYY